MEDQAGEKALMFAQSELECQEFPALREKDAVSKPMRYRRTDRRKLPPKLHPRGNSCNALKLVLASRTCCLQRMFRTSCLRANRHAEQCRARRRVGASASTGNLAVPQDRLLGAQADGCDFRRLVRLLTFRLIQFTIHSASLRAVLSDFRNCHSLLPKDSND